MVRRNAIALFNLNGTLTLSGQQVSDHVLSCVLKLQKKMCVGLISTCTIKQICQKIGGSDNLKKFDYVFAENGLVAMKRGVIVSQESIVELLGDDQLNEIINSCLQYLSDIEVPVKRGTFIDLRKGLISVCPIGHDSSMMDRHYFQAFDKVHNVRNRFIEYLQTVCFNELDYTLNGGTSFSIYPQGWDKRFCLKFLGKFSKVLFFGDKCKFGESDHWLHTDDRVKSVEVAGPGQVLDHLIPLLHS